jgi:c-di-GMP-binding flagellar brake protein YcgR
MSDVVPDRRRWRRTPVRDRHQLRLSLAHRVRLLDISMTGALIRIADGSALGRCAELRTTLGDSPFVVSVEIRRAAVEPEDGKWAGDRRLGVTFVAIDSQNRRCLERYLRQPASS